MASQLDPLVKTIHQPDGGFTYSPVTGGSPKSGYAVSIHKGRELVLPHASIKAKDFAKYAIQHWDLLSKPGNYFGAWHNPADGKVYLDVSFVTQDKAEAQRLAAAHQQIAFFDLGAGQSIETNAAGDHRPGSAEHALAQGSTGHHQSGDLICYWRNGAKHCFVPDSATRKSVARAGRRRA